MENQINNHLENSNISNQIEFLGFDTPDKMEAEGKSNLFSEIINSELNMNKNNEEDTDSHTTDTVIIVSGETEEYLGIPDRFENSFSNSSNVDTPTRPSEINVSNSSPVANVLNNDAVGLILFQLQNMTQKIDSVKTHLTQQINESQAKQDRNLQQLTDRLNKQQQDFERNLNQRFGNFTESLNNQVTEVEKKQDKKLNEVRTNFESTIIKKQDTLNKRIDNIHANITKTLTTHTDQILKEHKTSLNDKHKREMAKINAKCERDINLVKESVNQRLVEFQYELNEVKAQTKDNENANHQELCEGFFESMNEKLNEGMKRLVELVESRDRELVELKDKYLELENRQRESAFGVSNNVRQGRLSHAEAEGYLIDFDPGRRDRHPMQFLNSVRIFVERSNSVWENQILYVSKHLKGESNIWIMQNLMGWPDFESFANAFKRRYWSSRDQQLFVSRLMGSGDFKNSRQNLTDYVMNLYRTTRYLDNAIDIDTFLTYVSRHLPSHVSSTIATATNVNDCDELEALLSRLNDSIDSGRPYSSRDNQSSTHSRNDQYQIRPNPFYNRNNNRYHPRPENNHDGMQESNSYDNRKDNNTRPVNYTQVAFNGNRPNHNNYRRDINVSHTNISSDRVNEVSDGGEGRFNSFRGRGRGRGTYRGNDRGSYSDVVRDRVIDEGTRSGSMPDSNPQ